MNDLASNSVFMAAGLSNGVEGTHSCFSQILMTTAIEHSTPRVHYLRHQLLICWLSTLRRRHFVALNLMDTECTCKHYDITSVSVHKSYPITAREFSALHIFKSRTVINLMSLTVQGLTTGTRSDSNSLFTYLALIVASQKFMARMEPSEA
jgi:hypothetical protein